MIGCRTHFVVDGDIRETCIRKVHAAIANHERELLIAEIGVTEHEFDPAGVKPPAFDARFIALDPEVSNTRPSAVALAR